MTNLDKLSAQMRADWNRRVRHDYRFWMSDGVASDTAMWEAGERDYKVLLEGVDRDGTGAFLEIGCGVGRLLKPALLDFSRVIGFDVSEEAIQKAKEFLLPYGGSKLELVIGNGINLSPVLDDSIDVAISFASITSMPLEVIAAYLIELHRVLKQSGTIRLQVYLGEEQPISSNDTLHLRCFKKENFIQGVEAAGLDVESINELILPFQVSFKEVGIEAFIVSLRKSIREPQAIAVVAGLLIPSGETESENGEPLSEVEFWMTYNYAKTLVASGDMEKAKEALQHATNVSKTTAIDVADLLERIVKEFGVGKELQVGAKKEETPQPDSLASTLFSEKFFQSNLEVLQQTFPEIASGISVTDRPGKDIEVHHTPEGEVIIYKSQCLDHMEKPVSAAEAWAKRTLQEERIKGASHLVIYGYGAGYHVKALCAATSKPVSVIEADKDVFITALGVCDQKETLRAIYKLVVGSEASLDLFEETSEIVLRPQSQTISHEFAGKVKSSFYGKRGIKSLHPTIAVLGPLQGGTLPIAGYTARALEVLAQRTRRLDVSGYAQGFHLVDDFVKDKLRQTILQSRYVEMISHVILEAINEKPIDILLCMAQAPVTSALLTELRKRGIITVLWFVEDYLRFTYWQQMAQYYDYVFTIQKGKCIDAIKAAGAGEVHYLPCACDPGIHTQLALSDDDKSQWGSPVSFVGAGYHNRQQTFASFAEFPFKIWGTEWPGCSPFDRLVQAKGRRIQPEEYVKIFNTTDININLHSSDERDGVDPYGDFVNPRTFELASCGAFQLCDSRSLLPELFEPGKEIITFNSVSELKEQILYYMNHPDERDAVTKRAKERAVLEHTYAHRIKQMLGVIYSSKYESIKTRLSGGPWQKMIERAKPYPELHKRCKTAFERGEEPNLDGLISDIITGGGKLTETEQKLLFLYHVRKQIIRMKKEEAGVA